MIYPQPPISIREIKIKNTTNIENCANCHSARKDSSAITCTECGALIEQEVKRDFFDVDLNYSAIKAQKFVQQAAQLAVETQ